MTKKRQREDKQRDPRAPSAASHLDALEWGSHICQFYRSAEDMLATLIPYFQRGLENNEYCMWITAEPLDKEQALAAARERIPQFEQYEKTGQIEILGHDEWYLAGGEFDLDRVLQAWVDRHDAALAKGYRGMRITGNTAWLEDKDWASFTQYEHAIDSVIGDYKMQAI